MESFDYFLLIAEELNFSRAARRAYVSQQCLSTYVRRLEEEYGVLLFNRKPSLSLTPAGEMLLREARQINVIKKNICAELAALKEESIGEMNVGVSYGRAMRLMTYVLPRFRELYPKVTVNVHFGITKILEKDLLDGRLDCFVGIGTGNDHKTVFRKTMLTSECVDIAITEEMLRRYFPEEYPACKERFAAGVDLKEFEKMPFIINSNTNIIMKKVFQYLHRNKIDIRPSITVEANEMQLALCDLGVCFSFRTLRNYVNIVNVTRPEDNQICVFPIRELQDCCVLELVSLQNTFVPPYAAAFERLIRQCFSEQGEERSRVYQAEGGKMLALDGMTSKGNKIADYLQIAPK